MKFKKVSIAALFLCSLASSGFANDADAEKIKKILSTQIEGMKKLPVQGMTLVEAGGKTFFVSDNGRIVFTGKMFDMWNGVELKSVEDVDRYAMRIDVAKLNLNPADLGAINIGQGKKEVLAFVDPNSAVSHKFVQAAAKLNQYTFKMVMIPGADEESVEKVKKAACVENKANVGKALIDNNWDKILGESKDCDKTPLSKAIITSRVFGVDARQLPFVIRHDGYVRQGHIKDLDDWLSNIDSKSDKEAEKPAEKQQSKRK